MADLVCPHCGNKIGEKYGDLTVISLKVRGQRRRSYEVPSISAISCDWCSGEGRPLTREDFDAQREAQIQARLVPAPGGVLGVGSPA